MNRVCRLFGIILTLFYCVSFVGCSRSNPCNNETAKVPSTGEFFEETKTKITWVMYPFSEISGQNQDKINRILKEKGIACEVEFISVASVGDDILVGSTFAEWVKTFEKSQPLDILTTSGWSTGDSESLRFLKDRMMPLNEFLATDTAVPLRMMYAENEWKQVTLNGNIYAIPKAAYFCQTGYPGVGLGEYLAVNAEYSKFFDEFDGTYTSLRKIYNTIGDTKLRIVINGLPGDSLLYGLLGYSSLYFNCLPYSKETGRIIDFTQTEELRNLLEEIHSDLLSGILTNSDFTAETELTVLARFHTVKTFNQPGFTEYLIAPYSYDFNCNGKYGISVNSTHKELAFQVLSLCFSDPEILSLLNPGIDRDFFANRSDLLMSIPDSELAGFRLELSEKQNEIVTEYVYSINQLLNGMYVRTMEGDLRLNSEWNIDEDWETFIKQTDGFSDVCKTADEEIRIQLDLMHGR